MAIKRTNNCARPCYLSLCDVVWWPPRCNIVDDALCFWCIGIECEESVIYRLSISFIYAPHHGLAGTGSRNYSINETRLNQNISTMNTGCGVVWGRVRGAARGTGHHRCVSAQTVFTSLGAERNYWVEILLFWEVSKHIKNRKGVVKWPLAGCGMRCKQRFENCDWMKFLVWHLNYLKNINFQIEFKNLFKFKMLINSMLGKEFAGA